VADAADWFLQALADEGVGVLFGNPGSTELPLLDALPRARGVRYVLGLHEMAVVGMADGWAQAGGRLAAVNVHVQPGMANALAGVLNAARARVPMLVTVGQQVTSMLGHDPFLGGDVLGMAAPLAKACLEPARVADLPDALARAVRAATTPPCGPVVLSLPMDVLAAPAPPPHRPLPAPGPPAPAGDALDVAAALLAGARSPVVLAGDGVAHEGAQAALAALAVRLGAPVWGEPQAARVALAWNHPLWRGQLPPFAAQIRPALARHDVALAVGMPVFRLFGDSPGPPLPPHLALVHADVDPAAIGRSVAPRVGMVAGARATLEGLLARIPPGDGVRRDAEVALAAAARRDRRRAAVAAAGAGPGVRPEEFARAVAAAAGPRDLIVDEGLTSTRALRALLGARVPGTWLAHRGSALGWGLPAAVGAAMADPGRRVLCLQGDGSLLFGVHALWTAAREGVPLALAVADNGGYEILRAGMEGLTGRAEGPWPGLSLTRPGIDLVSVCAGLGAPAVRVTDRRDLPAALHDLRRRAAGGPAVLVVGVAGRTPAIGHPVAH
jgi:benzoylformate decarboxylase